MRTVICLLMFIALTGCNSNSDNLVYELRVEQVRCLEGFNGAEIFNPKKSLKCKGATEDAGVLEIKLYPAQEMGIVNVKVQDRKNASVHQYKITGCRIYDAKNWTCYAPWITPDTYDQYVVYKGVFSHSYDGTSPAKPISAFSGQVTTSWAALLKHLTDVQ